MEACLDTLGSARITVFLSSILSQVRKEPLMVLDFVLKPFNK